MASIFDYKFENGKVVKVEKKFNAAKVQLLAGKTEAFIRALISHTINQVFPGKFSAFSHFTTADLGLLVSMATKAQSRSRTSRATAFTVRDQPHQYANLLVKTEKVGEDEREVTTRYGLPVTPKQQLPKVVSELSRLVVSSIRISKGGPTSSKRIVSVEQPARACASFIPNLTEVSQATIAVFGTPLLGTATIPEAEQLISDAISASEDFYNDMISIRDRTVPSKIDVQSAPTGKMKGRQTKLRNSVLKIPDTYKGSKARSMIKNLMQVPVTDKSGMGYYAQSHYDGLSVTGVDRKYAEILQDFNFQSKLPVIRLTSADRLVALALSNACKNLDQEVLIVYEGNEISHLQRFWDGKKIKRTGIVPYPSRLFDQAFSGQLSQVYFYEIGRPSVSTNHTPEALYKSNQKLCELSTYYDRYGAHSFYSDWSSVISEEEYKDYQEVVEDADDPMRDEFAPTCKVRKGWVMVASWGKMTSQQALNNIANGRLHYLTWMYRANHFCATGDPGHQFVVSHAPLYDWVTGDEQVKMDPVIFDQLKGVVDKDTYQAFMLMAGVEDDEEEREEEDDGIVALPKVKPVDEQEGMFGGLADEGD